MPEDKNLTNEALILNQRETTKAVVDQNKLLEIMIEIQSKILKQLEK